jgi:2-succinyl-5-enolpyruvyl-6-hydroxy-3-cyclohexene-1-carboxylate synthase
LQLNETAVCQQLLQTLPQRDNSNWIDTITQTEQATQSALQTSLADKLFDGAIVADVVELIPEDSILFMGNSSPIRHLDQYGRALPKQITAYANRGASGIDGNLATALGMYTASSQPLVAVVGDITFFHDMNSLHLIKSLTQRRRDAEEKNKGYSALSAPLRLEKNITIVLLHNDGGSIFNRLPIAQIDPPFTELFLTPHGLDFEPVCRMFSLEYVRADSRDAFRTAFTASVQDTTARVITVHTDNQQDEAIRREINQTVLAKLKE